MANRQKQRIVNKKHLARIERENHQKRIIISSSIAVILIVLLLAGYGVLEEKVLKFQKPIITVGSEKVTLKQFQDRVKFERLQQVDRYKNSFKYMTTIQDEKTRKMFETNLKQLGIELEPLVFGQKVINKMADELVIITEAKKRGIEVTKKEIDNRLKAEFGYFPDGSPTPKPTYVDKPTSTLSPTQLALMPPEPENTETVSGTVATESVTPTATSLPTASAPAQSPTPLPTATTYTESAFQENFDKTLENLKKQAGVGEEFLRNYIRSILYRTRLRDVVTADVPKEQEQVWARHILVSDEKTAKEIRDKLANGEDFRALAKEYSKDPGTAKRGGDLGWFVKGRMDKAFEDAAFALKVGEISEPVKSSFGWHIIQALGHEMRPLSEYQYEMKRNEVFTAWLKDIRKKTDITIDNSWTDNVPAEPAIPPEMKIP